MKGIRNPYPARDHPEKSNGSITEICNVLHKDIKLFCKGFFFFFFKYLFLSLFSYTVAVDSYHAPLNFVAVNVTTPDAGGALTTASAKKVFISSCL